MRFLLLIAALSLSASGSTQSNPQTPGTQTAAGPQTSAGAQSAQTPVVMKTCDYIDLPDATALLGPEASASTAPSRGALLTCGYTSPSGDALTVSIADYGVPSIAQQFFEKTWELTKTATVEDSLGTSAFAVVTTDPPPARASLTAWKAEKIVTIEASGALISKPETLQALRAMMVKLLPKLPATPPPPPPQP